MKKSMFTEQQIAFALRQAESGTKVSEVCRKMGVAERLRSTTGRRSTGRPWSERAQAPEAA